MITRSDLYSWVVIEEYQEVMFSIVKFEFSGPSSPRPIPMSDRKSDDNDRETHEP